MQRTTFLCSCFLFACLVTFASCQIDYVGITLGTTKTDTVNPCGYKFYSVDVNADDKSYLSVTVLSDEDDILVTLSNQPFTTNMILNGGKPNHVFREQSDNCLNCATNITLDAICPFPSSTTWYITVEKVDDGSGEMASFSVLATQEFITVSELAMATEVSIAPATHTAEFADMFDFYHFSYTQTTAPIGQFLTVAITNATSTIGKILFNEKSVPALSYNSNTCVGASASGNTLVVDFCTWSAAIRSAEDFYIAVQPVLSTPVGYDIEIMTSAPTITPITPNTETKGLYSLVPSEIAYFSFDATNNGDQFINATISNVQAGTVEFLVDYNSLPFASCTGGSGCNQTLSNCCDSVSSTCELVIQPCQFTDGTFYLGVKPLTFESNTIPITFQVSVGVNDVPSTKSLEDSTFLSDIVSPSHYNFYEFSPSNDDDEATMDIHLYVDQTSTSGALTTLFVNSDNEAGDNCWDSIVSCTVSNVGSCSVQLTPCMFAQYDDWYISVYGGDLAAINPTSYTVMAKLTSPTELSESNLIMSSSLQDGEMMHYKVDEDLLPEGGLITFTIFDVAGGRLDVYQFYGGLAGPTNTCPLCFNYTAMETTTPGVTFTWDIANCDSYVEDNKDELYFSVLANAADNTVPVSFSLTLTAIEGDDDPSDDLIQNEVLVDSVQGNNQKNYSITADASEAYLTISLTQIDIRNGLTPMKLSLYNTSNLNCMESSFSADCTADADGYCFIVIQACQFNSSDGWIAVVTNDNDEEVFFNVFYEIKSTSAQSLSNNEAYPGTLIQEVYQQFEYSANGADTMIVEVFFDSACQNIDDDDGCPGSLYVSTEGPAGPSDDNCFYPSVGQTDNAKVVYAITGCDLPEEEYYFSVVTSATLLPNQPLAYTIRVREMDSSVPVEVNTPFTYSLYPGQRVYHTFSYTANPATGSRILVNFENVENGQVTGVLAQHAPPSADTTCPCFEYDTSLAVDYCDSVSGDWTVMVQATAASNQLVSYVITVIEFSQTPVALALGTQNNPAPVQGSVAQDRYQYYSIAGISADQNSQLILTLSTIVGGEISVFVGSDSPATSSCNSQMLCESESELCVAQIGSCIGSPSYISVYGETVNSFDPITYEIQVFESSPIALADGVASDTQNLQASFVDYFTFTIPEGQNAPYVTMTVNDADSNGAVSYVLSLFADSVCSTQVVPPVVCNTPSCQISYSACEMGTVYYLYVSNIAQSASMTYTVTGNVIDLSGNPTAIDVDDAKTSTLEPMEWVTFTHTVNETPNQYALSYTISGTGNFNSYFGYGIATPDCKEHQSLGDDDDAYTVDVCCVQNGDYYLSIMGVEDTEVTVQFVYENVVTSSTALTASGASTTVTVEADAIAEFTFFMDNVNSTGALWVSAQVFEDDDTPASDVQLYLERISTAGPVNDDGCITRTYNVNGNVAYYSFLNCPNSVPQFLGGTTVIGVENTGNDESTLIVDIEYGTSPVTPLTLGGSTAGTAVESIPSSLYYYSLSSTVEPTQQLVITVNSTDIVTGSLFTSCSSVATGTCNTATGSCDLVFAPTGCSQTNDFVVSVSAPASAEFTVEAAIEDLYPIIELSDVATSATGNTVGTISIPAGDSQFGRLILSNYTGTNPSLLYTATGANSCYSPLDLSCSAVAGEGNYCVSSLDSCLLKEGDYQFWIDGSAGSTYDVMFEFSVQTHTPIAVDSVTSGAVFENQRNSYNLTIDYTTLVPGSDLEIKLTVTCGSASLYLGQGSTAGPDCYVATGETITISSCDLSGAPIANYLDSYFSLTVVGGPQSYGEDSLNLPTQYLLEVDVTGFPETFRALGPNQVVAFGGNNINYVLPAVTGLENLAGQLEVTLTLGKGNSATLNWAYNEPIYCSTATNQNLFVNKNQPIASVIVDACTTTGLEQLYFQFAAGSDSTATFEVVHVRPFIRDLNEYDSVPQTGAVTPSVVGGIVDEEYYKISLDSTVDNFQFAVWIEQDDSDADIQLLTSQDQIPVLCTADDNDVRSAQSGEKIIYGWCDFEDNKEMYLTVDYPANTPGSSAYGYSLYYTTTLDVDVTALSVNQPLCDTVEAGDIKYYTAGAVYSPTTSFSVEIYSISSDGTAGNINGYLSFDGLATPLCADDEDMETCQSGTSCTWSFSCPFTGNASIAIENTESNAVDYFIVWKSVQVTPTDLTIDVASDPSTETTEYFSLVLPDMDITTQFFQLLIASEDGTSVTMWYNENVLPAGDCNMATCTGNDGACFLMLNSCDYPSGSTLYVLGSSAAPFTVTASIVDVNVTDLAPNSFGETTLVVTPEAPVAISAFKITITDEMLGDSTSGSMVISAYGVNQDTQIAVYVTAFGTDTCNLLDAQPVGGALTQNTLSVSSCNFAAGDYLVSGMLALTDLVHPCSPVTFGVYGSASFSDAIYTPLTSGTSVEVAAVNGATSGFSYTPTGDVTAVEFFSNDATVLAGLDASMSYSAYGSLPGSNAASCGDNLNVPTNYYFGCAQMSKPFQIETQSSTTGFFFPNSTYTVTATSQTLSNITNELTEVTFTKGYQETQFHQFYPETDSLQINVIVSQGPSVEVTVWDNTCASSENQELVSITCFYGTCAVPFSWSTGDLANATSPYYVTVTGYAPASYSISIAAGAEETCYQPESTELCDISWSVWNYNTGETGADDQALAAVRLYDQLTTAFCPSCSCPEISAACNSSLIEFACTQTYRACGDDGLQTSVCEDTCQDIQENCGYTFEEVGLPMFSCNHNFYYSDGDAVCEDIYGITETDGSDALLWVVVILVLFCVVLILVAVIIAAVFKRVKAKRQQGASYEAIDDGADLSD